MKVILKFASIFVLAYLSGCTIVDSGSIMTGVAQNPISVDQVRIYRVAPENYAEIAMISASAGHDFKSNSALIESTILQLKQEAAKFGANGVLLSEIDERDTPSTSTSYGSAQAYGSGGSAYVTGSSVSVNRGDTYTRMPGLAIHVP